MQPPKSAPRVGLLYSRVKRSTHPVAKSLFVNGFLGLAHSLRQHGIHSRGRFARAFAKPGVVPMRATNSFVVAALLASATAWVAPSSADAALAFTQDEAVFNAATSSLTFTTQTFDGLPTGSLGALGAFTVADSGNVTVGSGILCRAGNCLVKDQSRTATTFTFSDPVRAVGFFLGDGDGGTASLTVDGAVVGSLITPLSNFAYTFVGVYDLAGGFRTVTIPVSIIMGAISIDDVRFARAPAAVSEPAGMALLGAGLLGFAGAVKRRRRAA